MDDQPTGQFRIAPDSLPRDLHESRDDQPAAHPPEAPLRQSGLSPQHGGLRRALWWLLLLLAAAGAVGWLVTRTHEPPPSGRSQFSGPMPVGTATVETGDVPILLSALGTVTPLATVTVKPQIAGQLIEVAFKEGQMVKKGDFLAQIDPRPHEVALAQAEGQLAKNRAALRNAEIDLARYRTLLAQNSIARQTVDTQAALVQQNRGTVQADQALVEAQKLNLSYTRIVAPIGGRVGLRQVDPGNYVQTSDPSGIVVITQLQPISVIFTLAGDQLPAVIRRMQSGGSLAATAFDRTGATRLAGGILATIDNQIDTATGMVKLRAVFDNSEQGLFPNQFVNIQLLLDTLRGAPLVPVAAVQRGAPGPFVYVVNADETVTAQPVGLGPGSGQRVAVTKGVETGQVVVVDGADRLRDGAKVRIAGRGPAGAAAPAERPRGQNRQRSGE